MSEILLCKSNQNSILTYAFANELVLFMHDFTIGSA